MKTLILLTALAAIASAGPTSLGRDGIEQESRLNGVLKTIKRERKSLIQESPSDLSSGLETNSESLPSNIAKSSLGFRKPIIVKKKFGYHIYRDSDEELAQAEPRENCRRQFRFKLCDDDQLSNGMRNTKTEDIDDTDVEQSLRMAKEAVESLQRDLQKIERSAKLTQKTHYDSERENELHKNIEEPKQQAERTTDDIANQDSSVWKTIIPKSEETRMAEWKEAIENIQKNVELARNIEDTLKTSEHDTHITGEEIDVSKSRKTESLETTIVDPSLLTKDLKIEHNQNIQPKMPEEDIESYATENKDVKVSLVSENLKLENEATHSMHHLGSKMSSNEENKIQATHDGIDTKQWKSADANLQTTQHLEEKKSNVDNFNKDVIAAPKAVENLDIHDDAKELLKTDETDLKKNIDIKEKSASLENNDKHTLLKSSKEVLDLTHENVKIENVNEDIHGKSAEVKEEKEQHLYENKLKMKDSDLEESRIMLKSEKETPMGSKIESLGVLEPQLRSTQEINTDTNTKSQSTLLKTEVTDSLVKEHSQMRVANEDGEKQSTLESITGKEFDLAKLREVEDKEDKVISHVVSQARSVEDDLSEKSLLENNWRHDDKIAKTISAKSSETKVEALNSQHTNNKHREVEIVHEKQHHNDDFKHRKVQEHLETQTLHNKLEVNNRDMLHEANKMRLVGPSGDLHESNTLPMRMSEMDYYNDLNSQHSAQLTQDNNINLHSSAHIQDSLSNWNHNNYHMHEPYMIRGWHNDRYRTDLPMDSNPGAHVHIHHNHPGKVHFEDDAHHFIPMGRFVNNPQMGNKHELLNTMTKENIPESGRESEWDSAMSANMHMQMRDAFNKNNQPWGYRNAAFGSSIPLVGQAPSGTGAVGLFPNSNGGCGIPLLLSCSPSVVSGSLAKSHSLGFSPAFKSGDDMRFYGKQNAQSFDESPAINAKSFALTSR